ncbi:flagellar hook protein FlgE [Roseateles microcysteis]|uniref:flagellar hook protein FlgE n=1 Tax=Roseateles microcysteis TaxID=3119057 RepID=UPI002FE58E99
MLDSIFIGTSGLQAFSAGLKSISNNLANLNTPGFKSSSTLFSNLYYSSSGNGSGQLTADAQKFGGGVALNHTLLNFRAGELRQTGNPLDLTINGEGFFITRKDGNGESHYSRAGQFEFNKDGVLVARGTDQQVIGLGASGEEPISLNGLRISAPKATSAVVMTGNLSSSVADFNITSFKVIDSIGGEHALKMNFTPKAGSPGTWVVKVLDGTREVTSGEIRFAAGYVMPGFDRIDLSYAPTGVATSNIKLDFSSKVSSFDMGSTSSLTVGSTDGYTMGSLSKVSFDADGTMALVYSNGQTAKGSKLALAAFDANAMLSPQGGSEFTYSALGGLHVGAANQGLFGSIGANQIEGSNVDLATEFSDLIVAQRGYQAASRIVSTANDLIQDLLDMKGHR